jgi:predicted phosphodiesterase
LSETLRLSAHRVALLADVHGNAPALAAVLREVRAAGVDLLVSAGDLTWGSLVAETLALARDYDGRAAFVRGNGERAVLELAAGTRTDPTDREQWMTARHDSDAIAFLRSFSDSVVVDVAGLGAVRICHGSPRGDTECVTAETPETRVREFMADIDETIVATAHTHVQFDRHIAGVRSLNPGSVGMPYEGRLGAFWALLGPDVELRRTDYDLAETIAAYRKTDDPARERMVEELERPSTPAELIAHAEQLVFSD